MFCKGDGGKMKQYGVASFVSNADAKSTDKTAVMGYAATFTPDAQKHFAQWNPRNRPPNANTFKGLDELMNHKFFPDKLGPMPAWAKASGSSSSSTRSSSSSSSSSGGRSSSGYSRGAQSYGNQRSSGSSYKRSHSSSQGLGSIYASNRMKEEIDIEFI